jgi:hypothetical protein
LKSDPAWDEKGPGVGRREKIVSPLVQKNIDMAASVLLKLFSAQTHKSSFWPSPRPHQLPSPFKNDHHWRAPNFQRLIPDVLKEIWFL